MKISKHWLSEWVAVPADTAALAEQLTMAGLEVDSVEPAAPLFKAVVVGEIVACEPHPDAERLKVCQVDDGTGELKDVVCGAPNAAMGLKAPFAQVGARLPGDLKIKAAKLRGVKSHGMLCAARELGLSEDSEGLMPLPADAPVGEAFRDWLNLDDDVIEIELTPNRSDCLSVSGVAREVGVLNGETVSAPASPTVPAASDRALPIDLVAEADCPRYCGRVIEGVDAAAPTPMWLQERLRRAGVRPLGIVVDVTNYVMLELGQPMHAFDLERLSGGIRVRRAEAGETLILLSGEPITLSGDTLVIADETQPVALAGVMGGDATAVSETTTQVFLESAFFAPAALGGRARQYGLHTDASHRFERGVDPMLCLQAIERATALLLDLAGGQPGPVTDVQADQAMPQPGAVALRPARVNALLGTNIEEAEMRDTLTRLGMPPQANGDTWQVQAPSWRFDIAREVDLIEEIARVHGYNALPPRRAAAPADIPAESEAQVSIARQRMVMVDRGYQEAITYSFVDEALQASLDPDETPLALANPLSSDLGVMRTSLWPGLVRALVHNQNRQMARVRLFETGLRFRGSLDSLDQTPVLAAIAAGPVHEADWSARERPVDFFDFKADVEALLDLAGPNRKIRFIAAEHPALHPGQCARIEMDDEAIGWIGALHPRVTTAHDLSGPVFVTEVQQSVFTNRPVPAFESISRYPAIRRDLAIVVEESVSAQSVEDCIRSTAGEALRSLDIFDVYQGKGVSDGFKSLAMGLILQDYSRTLTDEEVEATQQRIVAQLKATLGAELRE